MSRPRRQSSLHPELAPGGPTGTTGPRRRRNGGPREHGWARATDLGAQKLAPVPSCRAPRTRRRVGGTPLLMATLLAVFTVVGLARVQAQNHVLELAEQIGELSDERATLLDRKRRLETERSFLRHPERVRALAEARLQLEVAPPERRQEIEVLSSGAHTPTLAVIPGLHRQDPRRQTP